MMQGPAVGGALALLAAVLLGIFLLIFGPVLLWGESVEGRVEEVHYFNSESSERSCSPVISYRVGEKSYLLRSSVSSSPCGWTEGEAVEVYFSASNPANGYAAGGGHTFPMLMLVVGCLVLSIMSVRAFRSRPPEVDAGAERPELGVVDAASTSADETVAIRGRIEAEATLVAPLSRRKCVAYEVEVRSPIFGEEGELIHRVGACRPFSIRDEQGTMCLLPDGVAVDVALEPERSGDTASEPNERLTKLLLAGGFEALDARTTDNHYIWWEGIVREGDEVIVYGRLTPETEAGGGYRAGAKRFVIAAPPDGEVVVANAPKEEA